MPTAQKTNGNTPPKTNGASMLPKECASCKRGHRIVHILLIALLVMVSGLFAYTIYRDNIPDGSDGATVSDLLRMTSKLSPQPSSTKESASVEASLTYTLPTGFSVKTENVTFPFTAGEIVSRTQECGKQLSVESVDALLKAYEGVQGTKYVFSKDGETDAEASYAVTVFPNKHFTDMKEFEASLALCAAGGDAYPQAMTSSTLLFADSCGSGGPSPAGGICTSVEEAVKGTLILK